MYPVAATFTIKHGNSFSLACQYTDDSGQPLDISSLHIAAYIKNANRQPITQLIATVTHAATGTFILTLPPCVKLPAQTLYTDIRLIDGTPEQIKAGQGIVRNSDILCLHITDVVTYG